MPSQTSSAKSPTLSRALLIASTETLAPYLKASAIVSAANPSCDLKAWAIFSTEALVYCHKISANSREPATNAESHRASVMALIERLAP